MSKPLYLLDTNALLLLLRGSADGKRLDKQYQLQDSKIRPLISRVTHGEMRVLAHDLGWGKRRIGELKVMLSQLVTVEIHLPAVLDAYVEFDVFSRKYPMGARKMGKNDLWIAACAKAAGATLLTTDKDFEHLDGEMLDVALFLQHQK